MHDNVLFIISVFCRFVVFRFTCSSYLKSVCSVTAAVDDCLSVCVCVCVCVQLSHGDHMPLDAPVWTFPRSCPKHTHRCLETISQRAQCSSPHTHTHTHTHTCLDTRTSTKTHLSVSVSVSVCCGVVLCCVESQNNHTHFPLWPLNIFSFSVCGQRVRRDRTAELWREKACHLFRWAEIFMTCCSDRRPLRAFIHTHTHTHTHTQRERDASVMLQVFLCCRCEKSNNNISLCDFLSEKVTWSSAVRRVI